MIRFTVKGLIVLLFLCLQWGFLYSQVHCNGYLINDIKEPVAGVLIYTESDQFLGISDTAGKFTIQIPEFEKWIYFKKDGYYTKGVNLRKFKQGSTIEINSNTLLKYSLEELLKIKVVSASKIEEDKNKSPANIKIINRNEIIESGALSLVEVIKNLPGFDVSQQYGSDGYFAYMRGFRSYTGAYYSLMLDGMPIDDLWFQEDKYLQALPLTNIERIEIVYGPSSSIYGINALTGVINIVSRKPASDELSISGIYGTGFNTFSNVDFNMQYKTNDLYGVATIRIEDFDVKDFIDNNAYEWTKDKYLLDTLLWGGVVNDPSIGGAFSSSTKNRAIDVRLGYKGTEIAYQYTRLDLGQGLYSALDVVRPQKRFARSANAFYIKHQRTLLDQVSSSTLIRYRKNDVTPDAPFIYAWNDSIQGRMMNVNLYQSLNSSWEFNQDFDFKLWGKARVIAGFKYERKSLQRDYDIFSGTAIPVSSYDPDNFEYPVVAPSLQNMNRLSQWEYGAYLQANYAINDHYSIVLGGRYNNNSDFGNVVALRGSFLAYFDKLNFKLMYGEGVQSPSPRLLYGSWDYQGSNENLEPIKSRTIEAKASYFLGDLMIDGNVYYINTENSILQFQNGAENVGSKNIIGADLNMRTQIDNIGFIKRLSLWLNYGFINARGEEEPIIDNGELTGFRSGDLGDIAKHKLFGGATAYFNKDIFLSVKGRYISSIETIYSNPIHSLPSYFVLDAHVAYMNIANTGIGLSLKVENLANTLYFHPGIGSADAGETPGYWEGSVWHGSQGYYSSKIPQPHRYFILSLVYDFH